MNIPNIPKIIEKIKEFSRNNRNNEKNINFTEQEIIAAINYGGYFLDSFIVKTEEVIKDDEKKIERIKSVINKDTYKFINQKIVEVALEKNIRNYEFLEDKYKNKKNSLNYLKSRIESFNKNQRSISSLYYIPIHIMKSDFFNTLYENLADKRYFISTIEDILYESFNTIPQTEVNFTDLKFNDRFICKSPDLENSKENFLKYLYKFLELKSTTEKDFLKMFDQLDSKYYKDFLTEELVEKNLLQFKKYIVERKSIIRNYTELINDVSSEILFDNIEQNISLLPQSIQKKEWMEKFLEKNFEETFIVLDDTLKTKEMVEIINTKIKTTKFQDKIISKIPMKLQTQELIDNIFEKNKYILLENISNINPKFQTQEIADFILKADPYLAQYIRDDLKNYEYSMSMIKSDEYNFFDIPPELIDIKMLEYMEKNVENFYTRKEYLERIPQKLFLDNKDYFKQKIIEVDRNCIIQVLDEPLLFQDKNTIKKIALYHPELIKKIDKDLITEEFIWFCLKIKNDISIFSEEQIGKTEIEKPSINPIN